MSLIRGRGGYPVNRALDVVSRQEAQGVAAVDGECAGLGLRPLPFTSDVILDL